jgi:beta-glucosidase
MEEVATAISDEARAKYNEFKKFGSTELYQGLTFWSPNINIFRDPRWGRGHETYGEDPLLTGKMGSAFIKGLQGNGKYRKLDATIKHYAVHSGPEYERHGFDAVVSKKDLYETYLSAFKYCIDHADPSAVMGAYNRVNGEPCCGSKTLLQDILYGEFGFKGYVVSDCGAIRDFHTGHKVTATEPESVALAVNNGCQLNCGKAYHWLGEAVARGLVSEKTITDAVIKLFEARFRLGMFDEECEFNSIPYDVIECDEHRKVNRSLASASLVLLKNNGILPLKNPKKIAVIGPNADDVEVLLGNYNGTPSKYTTLLRGIQEGCGGADVMYAKGCDAIVDLKYPMCYDPIEEALIVAKLADVVILCVGLNPSMEGEENSAENSANCGDKDSLELPEVQKRLIEAVAAIGKPTVFVNVSGSCVNLEYADKSFDAVIQYFYPGAEGGAALADVLFGRVSPSGRLPVTFYRSTDDLPDFSDYSMENRTYKFFKGTPVYPFGHGLSYSEISENWIDGSTVELKNIGEYDTAYTVLKYEYIPHKNLCDFKKVFIRKGETLIVKF